MKNPILKFFNLLALFSVGILSSSCAATSNGATRDAAFMVAKTSLDLAQAKISGSQIDVKEAGKQLGFQLVSAVKEAMVFNLAAEDKTLEAAVITAAGDAAKLLIEDTALNDPRMLAVASQLANEAISAALKHLEAPPVVIASK